MDDSHAHQANIKVGRHNAKQAEPRESHMLLIQTRNAGVAGEASRALRQRVALASHDMPQRVAR